MNGEQREKATKSNTFYIHCRTSINKTKQNETQKKNLLIGIRGLVAKLSNLSEYALANERKGKRNIEDEKLKAKSE